MLKLKRHSGILMPMSSLPSVFGIGDMGPQAHAFVDFAASCHQRYWQILPIHPTDGINGHSPYSCASAFAGNPLLISPQAMVSAGFCQSSDISLARPFPEGRVEYLKVFACKEKIFDAAFHHFQKDPAQHEAFENFVQAQRYWLDDFALYTVLKSAHGGRGWNEWPQAFKTRNQKALEEFVLKHGPAVQRQKFIQYLFFLQWGRLKSYANSRGVAIIGDIPIYVNYDSVEVWRHPSYFKIDGHGRLKFVSGCPPDYFSRTGQRWGNPVYDWAKLKKAKYSWWVERIGHALAMFDYLRIDHFRGFLGFWQIPAHEKLAVFGRWVKGPGAPFFKFLAKRFEHLPIIAEDLGEITPDVPALMKKFGFPGMRVLLFAFDGDIDTNPHVPAHYPLHCVAYTGTHDNNTVQGWFHQEAKPFEKANIARVLRMKFTPHNLHWTMIESLMRSKAEDVIIPMWDFLGLKQDGRMNTPATKVHNWQWRLKPRALTSRLRRKIARITKKTDRGGTKHE